jgi:hypothetical protein
MTEKGVNNVVAALSYFTQQIGGPKFSIPVIASLIGIAFEYNVKGLVKSGLLDVIGLATIPVIAILIKIIAYVATFTAAILVIDDICNFNILAHGHHENKPSTPTETPTIPAGQKPSTPTETPTKETQQTAPAAKSAMASATPLT